MFPGFDPIGFVLGVLAFIGVPWIVVFLTFIFFFSHGKKNLSLEAVNPPTPIAQTTTKRKSRPKSLSDREILVVLQQIEKIQDRFNMQLKD